MSAILKKRVHILPICSHFSEKGMFIMMSELTGNLHGSSKYISTWQRTVFRRKRESIMFSRLSILYKKGLFHVPKSQHFEKKVSERGSLLILKNDHMSFLL